jgi:predicted CXXCH cytochrome family protein
VVALLLVTLGLAAAAVDPPHDVAGCASCHLGLTAIDEEINNPLGNPNLCQSCHEPGGTASAKALLELDQAVPWPGLPTNLTARGTSHRWNVNPSGRVLFLGGAPAASSGVLVPSGTFTGRYAKTYTITISAGGNRGEARFDWTATRPGGGGGTNLATGSLVPLDEGVALSFHDGRPMPSFRAGDRWQILVRPDLVETANPDLLLTMPEGKVVCSTCHDQHSQFEQPFDPGAPAYASVGSGQGRHFMRVDNATDQLCAECHAPRFVTNSLAGSHPVGVRVGTNGLYRPPTTLPLDKQEGRMSCSTCHQMHFSPRADGSLLRASNAVALCAQCHTLADTVTPARHLSPLDTTLWPGGQYGSLFPRVTDRLQRGSCGNCHQVHGWPDRLKPTNAYPALLVEQEENLCYTCHDGSPLTKNIRANFAKTYTHPVSLSGRHSIKAEGSPADYGTSNRHSECTDCHNPHVLTTDAAAPAAPAAAGALRGVARVSVQNLTSSNVVYVYRPASDPTPVREYELCFTCHSAWTTQPAGQSNLAADLNDRNPSYHPVEGPGKNTNINPNSFVNGWAATNLTFCTDCHTSDDPTIRGPHGSTNRYLLKLPYTASSSGRTMATNEICFNCHRYDTYANNGASSTVKGYSRFNPPNTSRGHTYHVGSRNYPCYTCHDTHGSSTQPHLIVTGRNPGLTTYTRTANGGSCRATCHGNESYSVNYAR